MTLELQHISKSYDGLPVLKNLNLSFQQGQCYCLMSPSGSGKTTLLRILMGLEQADHGLILADGTPQDMSSLPASAVFQEDRLCESFSPIENVAMCAGRSLKAPRIKWELARLLPEECLNRPVSTLSGGMKRRVAIAGVMAMRPEVLILDEPTAGLDPRGREEILEEIKAYRRQTGATILLVSHSMEDVARHAQQILVMNAGKVFCYGTVENVFRRSQELQAIGLAVPQITRVCNALRAKGIPLTEDIFTVEQAKEQLIAWYRKKGEQ